MFTPNPAGVAAAPPASGLVAAAARPDLDRWEDGLAWVPERCGTQYRLVPLCSDEAVAYDPPRPGRAYYLPVGVDVADECSTLSGPVDAARVGRVAEANFPLIVARELWSGAGTLAAPYTAEQQAVTGQTHNAYLASPDADIVGSGGAAPMVGLARLEQAAMAAAGGQAIMLHLPISVSWLVAPSLTRVGGSWLTVAGNVVVTDAGYTGSGPAGEQPGATVWAYATSPVSVLATPWDVRADDVDAVDHRTNTRTVWASRVFAAVFDPCVHLATEITL